MVRVSRRFGDITDRYWCLVAAFMVALMIGLEIGWTPYGQFVDLKTLSILTLPFALIAAFVHRFVFRSVRNRRRWLVMAVGSVGWLAYAETGSEPGKLDFLKGHPVVYKSDLNPFRTDYIYTFPADPKSILQSAVPELQQKGYEPSDNGLDPNFRSWSKSAPTGEFEHSVDFYIGKATKDRDWAYGKPVTTNGDPKWVTVQITEALNDTRD